MLKFMFSFSLSVHYHIVFVHEMLRRSAAACSVAPRPPDAFATMPCIVLLFFTFCRFFALSPLSLLIRHTCQQQAPSTMPPLP